MALSRIGSTLHFEALVRAAHHSAQRGGHSTQGSRRISSRLARFTRRLVGGLLFGSRHGTSTPPTPTPGPSDIYPKRTMGAAGPPPHLAAGAVATFVSGEASPGTGSNASRPATPASEAPTAEEPAAGGSVRHGSVPSRAGIRPPAARVAARRNVNLTIPTSRMPLFLPAMLAMPALSPACTSLNSEVVTATASACGSVLASPAAHSAAVDARMGLALELPLSHPVTPAGPASAHSMFCRQAGPASAHDMLCRLAGTRCSSPPTPQHTDAREEWGQFVVACLQDSDRRLVPDSESKSMSETLHGHNASLAEPAGAAVVPQPQPQQQPHWFDALDGRGHTRLHELAARGIPAGLRRQVWMECAGALDMPASAVACIPPQEDIELDLPRTSGIHELPGRHDADVAKLRHVLYGYAAANPDTGYCQGMNKIALGLLAAGLDAGDALAMLRVMLDGGVLPAGLFRPPMARLHADQLMLEELVARWLPRLAEHLHATLAGAAPLAPVTVSWFLALFVDCLPEPHRLRVWDMLFVSGYAAVFQACLGILATCEDALLRCATPAAVYTLLQNVHGIMTHCSPDEFADRAFGPAAPPVTVAAAREHQRRQPWAPDH